MENQKKENETVFKSITTYLLQVGLIAAVLMWVAFGVVHFAVKDSTNVEVMTKVSQEAKQAEQRRNTEKAAETELQAKKAREHAEAAAQAEREALQDAEEVRNSIQ
jgi:uncharacterized protein HemX